MDSLKGLDEDSPNDVSHTTNNLFNSDVFTVEVVN